MTLWTLGSAWPAFGSLNEHWHPGEDEAYVAERIRNVRELLGIDTEHGSYASEEDDTPSDPDLAGRRIVQNIREHVVQVETSEGVPFLIQVRDLGGNGNG
jgi:hypothetical protein